MEVQLALAAVADLVADSVLDPAFAAADRIAACLAEDPAASAAGMAVVPAVDTAVAAFVAADCDLAEALALLELECACTGQSACDQQNLRVRHRSAAVADPVESEQLARAEQTMIRLDDRQWVQGHFWSC